MMGRGREAISVRLVITAILGGGLAACELPTRGDDSGDPAEVRDSFTVDPEVEPRERTVPDFEADEDRVLSAVVDPDGVQTDFVENEVVVMGDEEDAAAVAERHGGEIIRTLELREGDAQHVIRLHEPEGDENAILANFLAYEDEDREMEGEHRVSSEAGLSLLAVAAEESAGGIPAAPNVVAYPGVEGYFDGNLAEASDGGAIPSAEEDEWIHYHPNPFEWPHFNAEDEPRTGVTEAWRILASEGLIDPPSDERVPVGIVDRGFDESDDHPDGSVGPMSAQGSDVTGDANTEGCDGNCPWHGQNVTDVAVGLVDNGYGAAGTGGPVGRAVMVAWDGTIFSAADAVVRSVNEGAEIVNMSFGGELFWPCRSLCSKSMRDALDAISGHALALTSAGNDGVDVDDRSRLYWPCQLDGSYCVGGTEADDDRHFAGSNHGGESVGLWAPYFNFVGPDPEAPDNEAQGKGGTSFAAPFVSGVAAMVMAADESLSPDEVWDVLRDTAREGSGRANRYVDAEAAVAEALGFTGDPGDLAPPEVELVRPDSSRTYLETQSVLARAEVDVSTGDGTLRWRLNGESAGTSSVSGTGGSVSRWFDEVCIPEYGSPTLEAEVEAADAGLIARDTVPLDVRQGTHRIGVDAEDEWVRESGGDFYVPATEGDPDDPQVADVTLEVDPELLTCEDPGHLSPHGFEWLWDQGSTYVGENHTVSDGHFRDSEGDLVPRAVSVSHVHLEDVAGQAHVVPCGTGDEADLVACPSLSLSEPAELIAHNYSEVRELEDALEAWAVLEDALHGLGVDLPDPFPYDGATLEQEVAQRFHGAAEALNQLRTELAGATPESWPETYGDYLETTSRELHGEERRFAQLAGRLATAQVHHLTPPEEGGRGGWYDVGPLTGLEDEGAEEAFGPALATYDAFLTAFLVQYPDGPISSFEEEAMELALQAGAIHGVQAALEEVDPELR